MTTEKTIVNSDVSNDPFCNELSFDFQIKTFDFQIKTFDRLINLCKFDEVISFLNDKRLMEGFLKLSFTGKNNQRHRFTYHSVTQRSQKAILARCGKFFPVRTLVFIDVPLGNNLSEAMLFAKNAKIDITEAYDCLNVNGAVESLNFVEHLRQLVA